MDDECLAWCVTGADHLDEMVLRLGGAYWHRSETAKVPTDDTCPGGVEVIVDVRLEQLVVPDGEFSAPVVFLGAADGYEGYSFRAEQARQLADALLDVATLED
jgi:hypothetical protein